MKGFVKGIIAGVIILLIGIAVLIAGLALNDWKFDEKFEMSEFQAETQITQFDAHINAGECRVEFYDGETVTIEYPESETFTSTVEERDGVLHYEGFKTKWYHFITWNHFRKIPPTVVKLPRGMECNLDLTLNAGLLNLDEGNFGSIKTKINAGVFNTNSTVCKSLDIEINAGTINAVGVICSGKSTFSVSAGTINAKNLVCDEIQTRVSAGTINLSVKGNSADYSITADKSAGNINGIQNQTGSDPSKKLSVFVSAGTANVSFVD